jgi:glycosyltransferase involved in cell wall biosynthesis
MQPAVSIILPTFNRLQYLPATIASIFGQTFEDWELLISDDGSDPDTLAYLRTLHDPPRVRILRLHHTGRPGVARNAALRQARGTYIAFMDSDDEWAPQKLEVQIKSLQAHPDCRWSQTRFLLKDAIRRSTRDMPVRHGWILDSLVKAETVIALPSVVATRELLQEAEGFDEGLVMCEDYDLWLRLAMLSQIDTVDEPLTMVRRHKTHFGDPATSFRDCIATLDKVLMSGFAPHLESGLRRRRADMYARLAYSQAAAGQRIEALQTVVRGLACSWNHARWWPRTTAATLRALTPRVALDLVRRHRSTLRHRPIP